MIAEISKEGEKSRFEDIIRYYDRCITCDTSMGIRLLAVSGYLKSH